MVGSSLKPRSVDGPEKLWRHGNKFPKELLEGPGPPLLGFHPVSCVSELVSVELKDSFVVFQNLRTVVVC